MSKMIELDPSASNPAGLVLPQVEVMAIDDTSRLLTRAARRSLEEMGTAARERGYIGLSYLVEACRAIAAPESTLHPKAPDIVDFLDITFFGTFREYTKIAVDGKPGNCGSLRAICLAFSGVTILTHSQIPNTYKLYTPALGIKSINE